MTAPREFVRKSFKVLRLLFARDWRRGLRKGVAAAVEHDEVSFSGGFQSVVDVGANRGQFALFALHRFPEATLYCFEPLPEACAILNWILRARPSGKVFPVALGSQPGTATMHVSRREDSSSLLRPTARQTGAFPGTEEAGQLEVSVARLDDLLASVVPPPRPCLLKIDVQGNELDVLRGARASLGSIDEILVECSFVELYEGQAKASEVVVFLSEHGFALAGVFSTASDRGGRQLQGDFLFVRSGLESRGGRSPQ